MKIIQPSDEMELKEENRRRHWTQLRGRWLPISNHFKKIAL